MEPKKISFGFSKINKKPNFQPVKAKPEQQIELIKCLEGQEIKLVEEHKETAPIVIPMKEKGKTSSALASLMRRRAVLLGEEDEQAVSETLNQKPNSNVHDTLNDDLDKRAALEILADLQNFKETVHDSGMVLPILKPDNLPLDGAKESNLEDYESIPIEQYGLAMLRGMGWKESLSKQKKLIDDAPMVRPKGMGLGADKALKAKPLLVQPEANETLEIKKQAYVRILGGKHKDTYGQIEGFDDEAGRVIVKLAIGGSREAFNEFLCQPISKKEFSQYGKCINSVKYEEYKKLENEHGQIIVKNEEEGVEPKLERDETKIKNTNFDVKPKSIPSKHKYESFEKNSSNQRHDEYPSRSNRDRTRSRSHSRRKYDGGRYSDNTLDLDNDSSTNESDTDSEYERKSKHHKKSKLKSHGRKSKSSKNKSKHRNSSTERIRHRSHKDSFFSNKTDDERRERHINKKTKKSKKQRSRTPNTHRR